MKSLSVHPAFNFLSLYDYLVVIKRGESGLCREYSMSDAISSKHG